MTDATVRGLLDMLAEEAARRGERLDWEKHLPPGKEEFTAEEACATLKAALDDAGTENVACGTRATQL
jgi:hypothetical protein